MFLKGFYGRMAAWPSLCLTYSNNNLIICLYNIFSYELFISYELLVMNYL